MEHIQKYKIEDESLDEQPDNYINSQNSYGNDIPSKNNIFQKNLQNKATKIPQNKIQIFDLGVPGNKKSLQKNSNLTKSDNLQKINNTKNIQSMSNNLKLSNNINISNYQKHISCNIPK